MKKSNESEKTLLICSNESGHYTVKSIWSQTYQLLVNSVISDEDKSNLSEGIVDLLHLRASMESLAGEDIFEVHHRHRILCRHYWKWKFQQVLIFYSRVTFRKEEGREKEEIRKKGNKPLTLVGNIAYRLWADRNTQWARVFQSSSHFTHQTATTTAAANWSYFIVFNLIFV